MFTHWYFGTRTGCQKNGPKGSCDIVACTYHKDSSTGKNLRENNQSKPVSRHFNSSNHSISDFVASSLSVINGGNDCRKTKEMRLIHALGTLNPHGINERLLSVKLLLSRSLFVFLTIFSHTSPSFYFLLFFTYLSHCLILLYIAI